jgi:hypothetical protein
MRIANARFIAVVMLLALGVGGCSRSGTSKELAALDQAYRSGVLNKDEYEAKKAGVEAQSAALEALDKAAAAGVVSQAEYPAIKARLIAKGTALASLERARRAGVLTQEEYAAKKAALTAADASAASSSTDPSPDASLLNVPSPNVPAPDASSSTTPSALVSAEPVFLTQTTASPAAPAPVAPVAAAPVVVTPEPVATAKLSNSQPANAVPGNIQPVVAQDGLKTIDPPQGGKITYGQVAGQTTEAGAMGAVLRSLHNQLGDRPQVGKLFQVRGTESVAAFFSVTNRNAAQRNQGSGQIAGLILVTKVADDRVEAGLVTDDAARFPKTLSPMMKTLFGVWHPLAAASTGAHAEVAASSAPAPLRQITLPDRSASVSLPDGWQIVPNRSAMGTIVAQGPKGESAELGIAFLASDTNNPAVQKTMQTLRNGGLRNTAYANATYYPYGADPAKTFTDLIQGVRHNAGLPPISYKFASVAPVAGPPQQRCVHMTGTEDLGDGKGLREFNGLYCTTPPNRAGGWFSLAHITSVPVQLAAAERATLGAILQSFSVNQSVIRAQAAQIAAPAIEQIHAIGKAAANQAAAAHERNDIQNSSVYQRWDSLDKRSQEFENYQLGYSVISDTQNTAHGTFWNEDAEALVKSNPDRFEYVSAPNYWKGIDY